MNDQNIEWKVHMNSSSYKEMLKNARSIVLVCHGNILRSQVLEQYLQHYAHLFSVDIELQSFGIAGFNAYPNTDMLLDEVRCELSRRGIAHHVERKSWGEDRLLIAQQADIILVADSFVKSDLIGKMPDSHIGRKIFTFYEIIDEGDKSFVDTYDPITGRQDPQRFADSFSELDRIARKIISAKRHKHE